MFPVRSFCTTPNAGLPKRSGDKGGFAISTVKHYGSSETLLTKDLDKTLGSIAELDSIDARLSRYVSERL
jgi:hypothetical protein